MSVIGWLGPEGLVGFCKSYGSVWDGVPGGSGGSCGSEGSCGSGESCASIGFGGYCESRGPIAFYRSGWDGGRGVWWLWI